jgi:hypothetical protein
VDHVIGRLCVQGLMIESGILAHLKYVLKSKSIDVQRESIRALANLSADYAYTQVTAALLLARTQGRYGEIYTSA